MPHRKTPISSLLFRMTPIFSPVTDSLRAGRVVGTLFSPVWNWIIIPKHKVTLWLLTHHRLPVRSILARFVQNLDCSCGIYMQFEETFNHLFFYCTHAQAVRSQVFRAFNAPRLPVSLTAWTRWLMKGIKNKVHRSLLMCASASKFGMIEMMQYSIMFNWL